MVRPERHADSLSGSLFRGIADAVTEPRIILLLTAGPLLWMLGGYRWKWLRRWGWPIFASGACFGLFPAWRVAFLGLSLFVVSTLPYGEKQPRLARLAVFGALGAPMLWLDWRVGLGGILVTASVLSLFFWLSRRANWFTWKLWEALAGFLQAGVLVIAANRPG